MTLLNHLKDQHFPKPNNSDKLRLSIDMRQANTAILRERHPQPTIEDLLNDLNGAQYFSKLDLTAAYHQLELDEESCYITTFTTQRVIPIQTLKLWD